MGRRRAQFILSQLARQYPEPHKCLTLEVERVEREARRVDEDNNNNNKTRLHERCLSLLQELQQFPTLLPYIAQGCPSCLTAVLARVGNNKNNNNYNMDRSDDSSDEMVESEEDESVEVMMSLVSSLATAGALTDTIMEGINKNFFACIRLLFSPHAKMAARLLGRTIYLAFDGEKLAVQLFNNEEFWQKFDKTFFDSQSQRVSSSVLVACLDILRNCCGVITNITNFTNDSNNNTNTAAYNIIISRLPRLCNLLIVQEDTQVRDALFQLLVIVRLTMGNMENCIKECLTILNTYIKDRETLTFSEALAIDTDKIPILALNKALESLQKHQFDSSARLQDLHNISKLLFSHHISYNVAAALLVLLPGALKSVFAAASGVDEHLSAQACIILASAINEKLIVEDKQEQQKEVSYYIEFDSLYYQNSLVEYFFLIGGVVLLEDLLTDYSNGVVVAAVKLLRSLLQFSNSTKSVMLASKCIENLSRALESISQDTKLSDLLQSSDDEAVLLLILDTLALLDNEGIRLVPETTLSCVSTIATEARSNLKILKSSIHLLSILATVYPMAATLVLDYEYMSTTFAPGSISTNGISGIPTELDSTYIIGSFNIMSAIVAKQPSSVTFEWIETLVAASHRLKEWENNIPEYAIALWNVILQTVKASDDGCAYLFEDEEFVNLVLNALVKSCKLSLLMKNIKYENQNNNNNKINNENNKKDNNNNNEIKNDIKNEKSNFQTVELFPIIIQVARHMPMIKPQLLPEGTNNLLEALIFLIEAQKKNIESELLINIVLYFKDNDILLYNTALDIITDAGPILVPKLLEQVNSFIERVGVLKTLPNITKEEEKEKEELSGEIKTIVSEKESKELTKEIEDNTSYTNPSVSPDNIKLLETLNGSLSILNSVLERSEASRINTTLIKVISLTLKVIKLSKDFLLPLSCYTYILESLYNLLKNKTENMNEIIHILWYDNHIIQLFSELLHSLHDHKDFKSLRNTIYDIVQLLNGFIKNNSSLFSNTSSEEDKLLLSFALEYVMRDDFSELISRSIFLNLCGNANFRRYILESHKEVYLTALKLASENSNNNDNDNDYNTLNMMELFSEYSKEASLSTNEMKIEVEERLKSKKKE